MTLPPLTDAERARNLAKSATEAPGGGFHYVTNAGRDTACKCPIGKRHDSEGVLRPLVWPQRPLVAPVEPSKRLLGTIRPLSPEEPLEDHLEGLEAARRLGLVAYVVVGASAAAADGPEGVSMPARESGAAEGPQIVTSARNLRESIRTALSHEDNAWDDDTGDGSANPVYLDRLADAALKAVAMHAVMEAAGRVSGSEAA
jgi:hypothetical protein